MKKLNGLRGRRRGLRPPTSPQKLLGALLGLAVLLLAVAGVALAQSGGGYDLSWWTVDGGGYTWSEGGGYSLGGTAGQPDAGAALSGGGYTLTGGFWGGAAGSNYILYLPIMFKNY